jgi:hypothetical protein
VAEFKERIAVAGATLQSGFGYGAERSALRRGFPATGGAKRNRYGGGRICQTRFDSKKAAHWRGK